MTWPTQWSCLHWSRSFSMRSLISDIGAVLPPVVRLLASDWSAQSPRRADWLACTGLTWSWKLHGLFSELRRLLQLLALWYFSTRPRNQRRTEQASRSRGDDAASATARMAAAAPPHGSAQTWVSAQGYIQIMWFATSKVPTLRSYMRFTHVPILSSNFYVNINSPHMYCIEQEFHSILVLW